MDATPTGRVKATLANWTGVAYRIPRTELDKCDDIDALKQSGVYFLFGTVEESDADVVYIGQASVRKNGEGILFRLKEQKRDPEKGYWSEAVAFATFSNSFGPTEISYLEHRFCNLAIDANRYIVKNANDPSPGHITPEKESELEDFVDFAIIIMGTLGHKVFQPPLQTAPTTPTTVDSVSETGVLFAIRRIGTDAKGRLTSEGFVVLAGSSIRQELVPYASNSIKVSREKNQENVDENGIVLKDILFRSPSGAAAFVLGKPSNGYAEWKTTGGKTLKDVENSN
jgi:hypothetical protein